MSSMDSSSVVLSISPNLDVLCPARKRARVIAPFLVEKEEQSASLDSLPDECLYEILRRLGVDKDRSISACVSKRWLMLLTTIPSVTCKSTLQIDCPNSKMLPDLNQEICVEDKGHLTRRLVGKNATDVKLAAVAVGSSTRGGLGKLYIQGSSEVTDVGLSAIANGCPSLRVLSLWGLPSVTDLSLLEVAKGCPLLESLDLCNCPSISDKGLMFLFEKCPNLASLTLDSCSNIGSTGFQPIGRHSANLKYVCIKDCPCVGDQGIATLVSSVTSLQKLKLQNLLVSDLALAVIGYYGKNLVDLAFSGLGNVTEKGFWVMGSTLGLQKLKSLSIICCGGVTDLGLQAIAKGSPSLNKLCIRKSCFLSDSGLKTFAETATALENLQLEECMRITLVGVLGALLNCSQKFKSLSLVKCMGVKDINFCPTPLPICVSLKSLTIRGCPGFTSTSLAMVGKICPHLVNLDLNGQVGVNDASLLPLIESYGARFEKVNLGGCHLLTDAVVIALSKAHGDTLEMLNLDGCKNITDESILAISEFCSVLVDLDISRCSVSDYGVALLASARQLSLRVLSLAACSKVTQKSVPFLGNMGRSMEGLNLQKCNFINSHGIGFLEEKLWWCDILF